MRKVRAVAALPLAAVGLVACGSSASSRAAAAYNACKTGTQAAFSALSDFNSRMSVGMNLESYTTQVGNLKVVVDHLHAQPVATSCQPVVAQLNAAVDQYVRGVTVWNYCTQASFCDSASTATQPFWTEATARRERASAYLARLDGVSRSHEAGGLLASAAADSDKSAQELLLKAQADADLLTSFNALGGGGPLTLAAISEQDQAINTVNNGGPYVSSAGNNGPHYMLTATSATGDTFTVASDWAESPTSRTCTGSASQKCHGGHW